MMSVELNILNILNIFLFAGVLQGIVVAFYLWLKKPLITTHRILGVWVLLFALSNLQIIINSSNLYQFFGQSFTLFLPLTFNLFFGPLIWLFVKKSTDKNYRFSRIQWLHLIPGILEVIYFVVVYIQPLTFRQQFYMTHWSSIEPTLEVLAFASFAGYFFMSIRSLKYYESKINTEYSDATIETFQWLKQLLFFLLIFTGIWGILTVADVFFMGYSLDYLYFYPYYFFIAFIAYFVGFSFNPNDKKHILIDFQKEVSKELIPPEKQRYIMAQLHTLMGTKQLYLQGELRSRDVAKELEITVQSLSYVLNNGLQKSFHAYINELRVAHVIERLEAGDLEKKNLAGIAKDAGFNSESSFYRIFKKFTGTTPKNYLK